MTTQTLINLVVNNQQVQNVIIIVVCALLVLLVLKVSSKRVKTGRKFAGYNDPRRGYVKVRNDAIGTGSNGSDWHSGSYNGRKDSR